MKTWIRIVVMTTALAFALSACGEKKDEAKKDEKKEAKKDEKKKEGPPAPVEPPKPRFSNEQLAPLGVLDIPGFKRSRDGKVEMDNVAPMYVSEAKNDNGVATEAMTAVGNCSMAPCLENTAKAYETDRDKTPEAMWMSKSMRENADLVWEFGEMELDGVKVVTVYILSYTERKTKMGTTRSSTHKFSIHWTDGSRQVRVMVTPKRSSAKSLEEVKTKMTKEELKTAATEIFKAFATSTKI